MTPGQLREAELMDQPTHLRWLNSLRTATSALESRPRMELWNAGPLAGPSGTVAIDHPPFSIGAVILASIQQLDGMLALTAAPCASFAKLTDGRVLVTYQFLPVSGKFQLALLLVEAS
jgi:hypothetical protein